MHNTTAAAAAAEKTASSRPRSRRRPRRPARSSNILQKQPLSDRRVADDVTAGRRDGDHLGDATLAQEGFHTSSSLSEACGPPNSPTAMHTRYNTLKLAPLPAMPTPPSSDEEDLRFYDGAYTVPVVGDQLQHDEEEEEWYESQPLTRCQQRSTARRRGHNGRDAGGATAGTHAIEEAGLHEPSEEEEFLRRAADDHDGIQICLTPRVAQWSTRLLILCHIMASVAAVEAVVSVCTLSLSSMAVPSSSLVSAAGDWYFINVSAVLLLVCALFSGGLALTVGRALRRLFAHDTSALRFRTGHVAHTFSVLRFIVTTGTLLAIPCLAFAAALFHSSETISLHVRRTARNKGAHMSDGIGVNLHDKQLSPALVASMEFMLFFIGLFAGMSALLLIATVVSAQTIRLAALEGGGDGRMKRAFSSPLDVQALLWIALVLGLVGSLFLSVSVHCLFHLETVPLSAMEGLTLQFLGIALLCLACNSLFRFRTISVRETRLSRRTFTSTSSQWNFGGGHHRDRAGGGLAIIFATVAHVIIAVVLCVALVRLWRRSSSVEAYLSERSLFAWEARRALGSERDTFAELVLSLRLQLVFVCASLAMAIVYTVLNSIAGLCTQRVMERHFHMLAVSRSRLHVLEASAVPPAYRTYDGL